MTKLIHTIALCTSLLTPTLSQAQFAKNAPSIDLLKEAPVSGGLVVHAGAKDASLAVSAAQAGPWVVAIIPADAPAAVAIRAEIDKQGVAGQVTILDGLAGGSGGGMPFVANSVTVLVVDTDALGARSPSTPELMRVLRPDGVGRLNKGGVWSPITKARPKEMDMWAQPHGDATMNDRNEDALVGPPRSLQWTTGENLSQMDGLRTNGTVAVHVEPGATRQLPNRLVGRDPYTGVRLWQADVDAGSRLCFLMDDKMVYIHPVSPTPMPMIAYDARTGAEVRRFDQGFSAAMLKGGYSNEKKEKLASPKAILLDGVLVQSFADSLWALDTASGKLLWKATLTNGEMPTWPAAASGLVVAVEGPGFGTANSYINDFERTGLRRVVARDIKTGVIKWTWKWTGPIEPFGPEVSHLCIGEGRVGVSMVQRTDAANTKMGIGHLLNLDLLTGKQMWMTNHQDKNGEGPRGLHGHGYFRTYIRDGSQWIVNFAKPDGYSLVDGSPTKSIWAHNYRCHPARTTKNLMVHSLYVSSLTDDRYYFAEPARASCDLGTYPANGLIYQTSVGCGCFAWLSSTNAYNPEEMSKPIVGERLQKGTAQAAQVPPGVLPAATDWPMHMRDAARSNWVEAKLSPKPSIVWTAKLGTPIPASPTIAAEWKVNSILAGAVTAPTAAEGAVVVALADRQAIVSLDPATGKVRWSTPVAGRVDTPPTIYKGLVLAGTRLGWVYALNRDTGAIVWRYFAAPSARTLIAHSQVESAWPLFGTVSIVNDTAWVVAGREISLDGGFYWVALDPLTGQLKKEANTGFDGSWFKQSEVPKPDKKLKGERFAQGRFGCAGTPPVSDGKAFYMQQFGLDIATGKLVPGMPYQGSSWTPDLPRLVVPGSMGFAWDGEQERGRHGQSALYAGVAAKVHAVKGGTFVSLACGGVHVSGREGNGGPNLKRWTEQKARDPKTGWVKEEWSLVLPNGNEAGHVAQDVAVAGDTVVYTSAAKVYGVSFADGKPLWEIALPAKTIFAGLAIANNTVYVTCEDGSVVALK